MRKKKKVLSIVLIFMFMMTLFTACNINWKINNTSSAKNGENSKNDSSDKQGDEVTQPTEAAENDPVTLSTVSMYGGTDANASNYQAINEQFIQDYPYITIEDDSQSSDQDWKSKIAADFAVGNEPDVILYFTDANASDVLAANKFVTIEEIRAVYPEYAKDTLVSSLTEAANPDGVQRAVPITGYWEGLFCNKDLFDRYGLQLPTDWEKLLIAIEVFKNNNIIPIAISLNNVPHYLIENLLLSAAGPEGYTMVPTSAPEDWCKGLDMVKTLRDLGAFPADADTIDNDYASDLFMNKKAAMQMDGSWYLRGIPDQDKTVVIPFPVIPDGKASKGSMVGGISSGFYITKKAWNDPDKRDAAVKFVMAHTSSAAVQVYWNGIGQAAAKVNPVENMTPLGNSGLEYIQAATNIFKTTDSRISQEAYNTLISGIVDISTGAITSEDLLNEVLAINAK